MNALGVLQHFPEPPKNNPEQWIENGNITIPFYLCRFQSPKGKSMGEKIEKDNELNVVDWLLIGAGLFIFYGLIYGINSINDFMYVVDRFCSAQNYQDLERIDQVVLVSFIGYVIQAFCFLSKNRK